MTDEQLREIEERANAALPGPWSIELDGPDDAMFRPILGLFNPNAPPKSIERFVFDWMDESLNVRNHDAAFIAHAREDIPALIAEIRRLQVQPISESYHGGVPEMPEQLREMLHEIPPTASGFGEIPNRTLPQPPDTLNPERE